MSYLIDAWLDCAHPSLTIFNTISGREVLRFNEDELHSLVENGDLCVDDLLTNNPQVIEEVIRQLALYRCGQSLSINRCIPG